MDIGVSIIIPVYNTEKYLNKCLDSLYNQTFKNFEIICINDGSTDNSLDILKSYQKKFNNFTILNQQNSGAASARNKGIKKAIAKYILFLDSDDYFEFDMVEKLYKKAQSYNSDITVCSSKKVDDNGKIIEVKNPNSPINFDLVALNKKFNYKDYKDNFFSLLTPVPWNKLFLRKLIVDNDIEFPELKICEDVAFVNCALVCANNIVVFDDELINYHYNNETGTIMYRSKYTIDIIKSMYILKDFLIKKGLFNELKFAFYEAFKNYIRWETTLQNDIEYEKFLKDFIQIVLKEDLELLKPALKKDYINFNYLKNLIGNKKIMLWGASLYIKKILENGQKLDNIIGIIDKNVALQNKTFVYYQVLSPDVLKETKPDCIIVTVYSNWEITYPIIKKEINEKYPDIVVADNIFTI